MFGFHRKPVGRQAPWFETAGELPPRRTRLHCSQPFHLKTGLIKDFVTPPSTAATALLVTLTHAGQVLDGVHEIIDLTRNAGIIEPRLEILERGETILSALELDAHSDQLLPQVLHFFSRSRFAQRPP